MNGSLLHNMQMNSRHGPFKSKMKRLKKNFSRFYRVFR